MAFIEVTNPGLINAGSESAILPIVTDPAGLPVVSPGSQNRIPSGPIPDSVPLPVTTNPPQSQLPSVGAPVTVNIK
jgi:hypothetical protein